MAHLAPALAAAAGEPGLLAATRAVADAVNWYQIYRGEGVDPGLAEGMLAGQIAGQVGILASDTLRSGLFLLAPGLHYPLHTHGAAEIYYCLSGRLTVQHGTEGTPFELHPGDCSVTPANRLHSLDTGEAPVLLLYVWIGDIDAPNWWWERRPGGGWRRVNWSRTPDGSWARIRAEPVTEAHLRQANG
jgi:quercetin dioxygenase-like cupin family protein